VDDRAIFQLHWGVELEEEDSAHIQEMMKHVEDLHSKAMRYVYETAASAVFIVNKHLSPPHPFLKFILMLSYQPNVLWYINLR
jgi:hypothetical protein